jgi:integrase/recombinase XerD
MIHYLSHYIRCFLTQYLCHECNRSDNTIMAYRDSLKLLLRFIHENENMDLHEVQIDQFTAERVRRFLDHLETQRNCAVSTRNVRLAAIKSFTAYIGREAPEYLDLSRQISQIRSKQTEHKTADYLEDTELQAILTCVEKDESNINRTRDQALLMLMYNTGARAQEIVDLTIDDLRLDQTPQVHITGKGRKQRSTPLWPETVSFLKNHLADRTPTDPSEQHLFLNYRRYPITRFGIRYIVRKYTNAALATQPSLKRKTVTPHTFRHTTAMHLLQAGNELNMIRMWLGHASLNTTHMYVEIDMKMKQKILATTTPPPSPKSKPDWQQPEILKWLDELTESHTLCEVTHTGQAQVHPQLHITEHST